MAWQLKEKIPNFGLHVTRTTWTRINGIWSAIPICNLPTRSPSTMIWIKCWWCHCWEITLRKIGPDSVYLTFILFLSLVNYLTSGENSEIVYQQKKQILLSAIIISVHKVISAVDCHERILSLSNSIAIVTWTTGARRQKPPNRAAIRFNNERNSR